MWESVAPTAVSEMASPSPRFAASVLPRPLSCPSDDMRPSPRRGSVVSAPRPLLSAIAPSL